MSAIKTSGRLRNPLILLALVAAFTAIAAQSGELGTSDTTHRLQTTHSWWTSQSPVLPSEYPEFGIHGRRGRIYSWYGMGQSVLMLPFDIAATAIAHLPAFDNYDSDPSVRSIIVTYSVNTLICVLSLLVCFRLLRRFRFSVNQSLAGALALLFGTTYLHYTQNMMENDYIFLLTLAGLCWQFEWAETGSRRALAIGSCALGLNLLTRLTTAMDTAAVGFFLLLYFWLSGVRGSALLTRAGEYLKTALPIYAVFGIIDRVYHFYRFGSWTNTYLSIFAAEERKLDPSLPPNFPFTTPFLSGFIGPFTSPQKCIFLFDPLLILTVIAAIVFWGRLGPTLKAFLIAFTGLLFFYISFYARYYDWAGDSAWGDRYISTSVQYLAFISVPIMLRWRAKLTPAMRAAATAIAAFAVSVQIASLAFWCPLEIYQADTITRPWVVFLRFKNIVAFAFGKMSEWGLVNDSMQADPWDWQHITTWNFLPFVLRRVGDAPDWVVVVTFTLWLCVLAALLASLLVMLRKMRRHEFDAAA
jgi:hypothetical protein